MPPPRHPAHAVGIGQIEHRILAAAELHALVLRRQEPAAPQPRIERLVALTGAREQHDERRQIAVVGSDAVREPGADGRTARLLRSGLEERHCRIVVDRLGVHRLDDAELVHDLGGVRQQFADPGARLAVPGELELRSGDRKRPLKRGHAGQALPHADRRRQFLAVHRAQLRLVVEQLELRRPATLKEVDDALRARHEVRGFQQRSRRVTWLGTGLARENGRIEQARRGPAHRCRGSSARGNGAACSCISDRQVRA